MSTECASARFSQIVHRGGGVECGIHIKQTQVILVKDVRGRTKAICVRRAPPAPSASAHFANSGEGFCYVLNRALLKFTH